MFSHLSFIFVNHTNTHLPGAFITDGRVPHALLNEILAGGEEGMGSGGGGTVVTL